MAIAITTLMCHAPIVVPGVSEEEALSCALTTQAMQRVAQRLVQRQPQVVVVVSPHTPREPFAWGIVDVARITGDMRDFGAPQNRIDLPAARDAIGRIAKVAPKHQLQLVGIQDRPLDHGASVPLWFLQRAGWRGETMVMALPWKEGQEVAMGRALAEASGAERWAIVASGDMSHRLKPGAPSGFHPEAHLFDEAVVEALEMGDLRGVANLDPGLRKIASEDVVASVTVAAGATNFRSDNFEVFAYEGPFGVGYCEAVLYSEAAPPRGR